PPRPPQGFSRPSTTMQTPRRAPDPDFKPDRPESIRVGMKVLHNIFGPGEIISIEGTGSDAKAIFKTESGEIKKLLLKFAKLKIIG
ncbi:MAG: hypothetical protein J5693_00920, partial [Bacteroidales bacterium]|nr:hypothetical protein [Bacteroidales bacterium]